MKIGYPCINNSIESSSSKTFRLASYSEPKLIETVSANLAGLMDILTFNVQHGLLFFRITSDLVPFASHAINTYDWQNHFRPTFEKIGAYIRKHQMRISMHPGQFVLINSPHERIAEASIRDLEYHVDVLELLGLNVSHKAQIHVGGIYGDKLSAAGRFVSMHAQLSQRIQDRLAIENDERLWSVADCMAISKHTNTPVLFDTLHHEYNNNGESVSEGLRMAASTWKKKDGVPMIDYSSQAEGKRVGGHCSSINPAHFKKFLIDSVGNTYDVMLEIKDKEVSALEALRVAYKQKVL